MFYITGEALGAIGKPESLELLQHYSQDPVIEVYIILCKTIKTTY